VVRQRHARHGTIDCLKVDIEGHETVVFEAIPADVWTRIRYAAVEDPEEATRKFVPPQFSVTRYISVLHYRNRALQLP